jgi:hypothetical protein
MCWTHSVLRVAGVLIGAIALSGGASLAIDPTAAEFSVAFAQADKIKIDPKPAKVELYAVPEDVDEFAVLELNGNDAKNYAARNPSHPSYQGGDNGYKIVADGLKVGSPMYGDRKYLITTLPNELAGLPMLLTRNAHKAISDVRFSIGLTCDKPCYVFLALDERALATFKKTGAPAWLQEYSPTDWRIVTDEPQMTNRKAGYAVFARQVPAGRIALGAPCLDLTNNCMYFAFFAEAK